MTLFLPSFNLLRVQYKKAVGQKVIFPPMALNKDNEKLPFVVSQLALLNVTRKPMAVIQIHVVDEFTSKSTHINS